MNDAEDLYDFVDRVNRENNEREIRQMEEDGYVQIPVEFRVYFNNQKWINRETLRHLRAWLTDDTVYKLVKSDFQIT